MTTAPTVDPAIERGLTAVRGMDDEETRARPGKPQGEPLPA